MQFKRLTNSELDLLQSDFIKFLAFNGIDASSWENIKHNYPKHCEELIENFSDLVYSTSLKGVQYLMKNEGDLLFLFKMESEEGVLHIFKAFSDINNIEDIDTKKLSYISTDTRKFSHSREQEIFNLIESGCVITTKEVHDACSKLVL